MPAVFNPVDEQGMVIPKAGTRRREVYDLYRAGATPEAIARQLGIEKIYVQVILSRLKHEGAAAIQRVSNRNTEPVVGVSSWAVPLMDSQRARLAASIGAKVDALFAAASPATAPRERDQIDRRSDYEAGATREEAQRDADRLRQFWCERGYLGIVAEPINRGFARDGRPCWGVASNIGPNGFPPRHG
jgi:hypothetical protein